MEDKTMTSRENTQTGLNGKSKSNLSTARSVYQRQEKSLKPKSTNDPQTARNFRFGPAQNVKKVYQKNSDKTIKPPEKLNKKTSDSVDGRSVASSLVEDATQSIREEGQNYNFSSVSSRNRSITDNFPRDFARVDTKTINDLEKRVENLQSILLKKVEMLKIRSPEKLNKEYKFIALVMGEESKLLVKENDTKSFPNFLPAKSIEDLNRKASEFFVACLLSFVDKLRYYQDEGRCIDCDEIYEDLKNEEKEYCCILQDWISELCDDEEKTLTTSESEQLMIEFKHMEMQTEAIQEIHKMNSDQEVQTGYFSTEAMAAKCADLTGKIDRLRLENYELKDQLAEEKGHYVKEIENLERKYKETISDIMDSWQKEKVELSCREEVLIKEQKMNMDLSQQAGELKNRLNELMEKHEVLLKQKHEDDKAHIELDKCRNEIERLKNENTELQDLKTHFLKKLDQRYEQIELQEKEIKLQKRAIQTKDVEIENIKKQYDAKIKENRQIKESLEARNKLIDHLRNAVEIDQKKIREFEILIGSTQKFSQPLENEIGKSRDTKLKTCKSRSVYMGHLKTTKATTYSEDSKLSNYNTPFDSEWYAKFNQKIEDDTRLQQKREGRQKKKDYNRKDTKFREDLSTDNSSDFGKTANRNAKAHKRIRDIVVKKYDM